MKARGPNGENPEDKRTGNPRVCRSEGWNSNSHYQFSGECSFQRIRTRQGTADAYMADTVAIDLANGRNGFDILEEITLSLDHAID